MNGDDRVCLTKLALLIDGENLPAKFAEVVVKKAGELGIVAIARVYGHASNSKIVGWEKVAKRLRLSMIDVSKISKAKDSADFKLIVEAMDMLQGRQLDGFCVASSDGDFSALGQRIRAGALSFYGFGEDKTPPAYRKICDDFFDCVELLAESKPTKPKAQAKAVTTQKKVAPGRAVQAKPSAAKPAPQMPAHPPAAPRAEPPIPKSEIQTAYQAAKKDAEGWALQNAIGTTLHHMIPGFDVRKYGFRTMRKMFESLPGWQLRTEGNNVLIRSK